MYIYLRIPFTTAKKLLLYFFVQLDYAYIINLPVSWRLIKVYQEAF